MPTLLLSAAIRWKQGFTPALFYLLGYGSVLLSFVVLVLRAAGVVQPGESTAYLFPLAVAAEAILFSFALAYRIQILKQEKADAILQADREKTARLAPAQASAADLQRSVELRTAELAGTNERLRQREQELQHTALHDPLTELPNRRCLVERCEAALANAKRHNQAVALLLIDLDHFKPINDRYGHDAGDQMLRAIAQRLLAELAQPVLYGAEPLTVTISIGVALYPQHARQFSGLYKAADEVLYKVKARGRSGSSICGEDGELSSSARLQLDVLKVPSGL
ncbi:diguanylate cyclase (GGDEF) domain-containing protein [Pseudomonas benzenivorans]|nr:diguanylate cyclase (GGDEF) domain-containing protein [Pseudomonas benzenivorans]